VREFFCSPGQRLADSAEPLQMFFVFGRHRAFPLKASLKDKRNVMRALNQAAESTAPESQP